MNNWINWRGGKRDDDNPVPGKTIDIKFRSGNETHGLSDVMDWSHDPDARYADGDIVAYREREK